MHETLWFLIVGSVLVFMGVAATTLRRLPVSAAMVYVAIGYALGPPGVGLLHLDMAADAHLLRMLTEVALLVSLFADRIAPARGRARPTVDGAAASRLSCDARDRAAARPLLRVRASSRLGARDSAGRDSRADGPGACPRRAGA